MDKAILAVSFGTSHLCTRKKTIDKITDDIRAEYTEHKVYSAFASHMIVKKLRNENIHIDTVEEAFERLIADGIKEVMVQPTYIIKGIEYDRLCAAAEVYQGFFDKMIIGEPLLSRDEDFEKTAAFIEGIKKDEEALVLMGHGSRHFANSCYGKLQSYIKKDNIFIGTVEAEPTAYDIARRLNVKNILLTPFMIVAGEHAINDMAGDGFESWKNIFTSQGFGVKILLKGLGEYEFIRNMFIEHIRRAL